MQATATLKRQLATKGQACDHIRSDAWGVIHHIYKEDGLAGFWKGEWLLMCLAVTSCAADVEVSLQTRQPMSCSSKRIADRF